MSDGARIAVDLHLPSLDGTTVAPSRFPVLLDITPYGKDLSHYREGPGPLPYKYWPSRGFVRAQMDVRGTGASDGNLDDNYFSPREVRDSYEAIEWLGTQAWSNGRVAAYGDSYRGISAYFAATQRPPHLKAIAADVSLADLYRDISYHGGMLSQFFGGQFLAWQQNGLGLLSGPAEPNNSEIALEAKLAQAQSEQIAWDYLANPLDGEFYRLRSPVEQADRIEVPTFVQGGWFDGTVRGQSEMYTALARRRGVETRLWMDPTPHKGPQGYYNPVGYPDSALDDPFEALAEFFDRHLNLADTPDRPPVKLFVMGRDKYIEGSSWPPAGVRYTRFYASPGSLATAPAAAAEQSYRTNAGDGWTTTLSRHGNNATTPYLPLDQSLEDGQGLVWQTPKLEQPLTLAGPLSMRLVAASTAPDTDWIVRVSDVAPGGTATLLTEGYLRASHRALDPSKSRPERPYHPHTEATPVPPGEFLPYEIEIWPTANEFKPGHRLRVQLTSNDTPNHMPGTFEFDRESGELRFEPHPPATNTVRFGGRDGTSLLLPVLGKAPTLNVRRPRIKLAVRPGAARAGRRTRFRFRTTAITAQGGRPLSNVKIRFAGRTVKTGRTGAATAARRFKRPGRYRATASRRGFKIAVRYVRVR